MNDDDFDAAVDLAKELFKEMCSSNHHCMSARKFVVIRDIKDGLNLTLPNARDVVDTALSDLWKKR
jgi:hypothetical protein